MRNLDDIALFQCRFVSDLFEYASKRKEGSSKVFIQSYVHSKLAKRISSDSFFYESTDIVRAYEDLKNEKSIKRGSEVYPTFVMAWIGYIMKYFEASTSIPMSVIYKKIKPEEFYEMYEAYHSLDNEQVIKRIAEAKNINIDLNNAELMKKISRL